MDATFPHIRKLFLKNGSSDRNIEEAQAVWEQFTKDEQRLIYNRINYKLSRHLFVHFIPARAIVDNAYGLCKTHEPTNYNRRGNLPDEPLVRAKYKNGYGIFTAKEADEFHMTEIEPFTL